MVTRIRQLLDWQQISPTQFADLIGVGRPVVSHILSERNKPSLEVVQRIIAAFPAISLPWLLTGTGEMLAEASTGTPSSSVAANPAPKGPTLADNARLLEQQDTSPIQPARLAPASQPAAAFRRSNTVLPTPARFVAKQAPLAEAAPFVASGPAEQPAPSATPAPVEAAPVAVTASPAATQASASFPAVEAPVAAIQLPTTGVATTPQVTNDAASMAAFLGEPGKAIRRIVIFYRDGSFADYQPEA
ncbi:helix-turn-helix domain-containing protein [Hymenobacter sp. HMF4947]|uniref:Helix-turn-helix domain-containing protein n=1 Tax=Hymenobacter ginkgonis TaxID=2682976 RepID=A0A7K1TAN1_9BACT|nr:helix-turn-helix transcriptional regulator [Hymenobacter ginkgonis]MVN75467.1 helix-turn-helix domain-containing protein [Hymenobacter ginkgonis]